MIKVEGLPIKLAYPGKQGWHMLVRREKQLVSAQITEKNIKQIAKDMVTLGIPHVQYNEKKQVIKFWNTEDSYQQTAEIGMYIVKANVEALRLYVYTEDAIKESFFTNTMIPNGY